MNDTTPTEQGRRRQYLVLASLLALVMALSAIGVHLADDGPADAHRPSDPTALRSRSYIAPGEKVDPHDAWRGISDTRLNTLEQKLTSMESENRDLKRRFERAPGGAAPIGASSPEQMTETELDRRLAAYERGAGQLPAAYPPGSPSGVAMSAAAPTTSARTAIPAAPSASAASAAFAPSPMPVAAPGILTVRVAGDPARQFKPATASPAGKGPDRTSRNYLPSGMFGQAVLLSGLDAPTGGQAQSNPHPVLLQLVDLAVLPNRYRYDWDRCLITAAGFGDLSSERSYIRTESLSCVGKDGTVLDVPIKGYIVGEDGKAGVRGRLISKQGQVLGNALLAGVVSGIGSGVEKAATIQSVSPLGATSTVKPGREFGAGLGEGVGRSLDRLAAYYIQLAEKMFPVIEVDAGRVVDVVLTRGVTVDLEAPDE